jgi:predicted small lipoprotein YifL
MKRIMAVLILTVAIISLSACGRMGDLVPVTPESSITS